MDATDVIRDTLARQRHCYLPCACHHNPEPDDCQTSAKNIVDELYRHGFSLKHDAFASAQGATTLHDEIKAKAEDLEASFAKVKGGRYNSLAITSLEQAVMWILKELTS